MLRRIRQRPLRHRPIPPARRRRLGTRPAGASGRDLSLSRCLLALLGLFALSACRPLPPADLTILNGYDPSALDPLLATGIEELRALQPLFEGLTRFDPATSRAR